MIISLSYSMHFIPTNIWRYHEETHKRKESLATVTHKLIATGESQRSFQDTVNK